MLFIEPFCVYESDCKKSRRKRKEQNDDVYESDSKKSRQKRKEQVDDGDPPPNGKPGKLYSGDVSSKNTAVNRKEFDTKGYHASSTWNDYLWPDGIVLYQIDKTFSKFPLLTYVYFVYLTTV